MLAVTLRSLSCFVIATCIATTVFGQSKDEVLFRSAPTFFPNSKILPAHHIEWHVLDVPQHYDSGDSIRVQLAIAVLPQQGETRTRKNPVAFIQGGPGGGSISTIWRWLSHPLRKERDIVLIDLRGTGFSTPSLCPDLGKTFFDLLAADMTAEEEISARIAAASSCREEISSKGLDLKAFNSKVIARDLHHALKKLSYDKWCIYGGSYGTHIAQEYAGQFPGDITAIVLDSPIPLYSQYYSRNTKNFHRALSILFERCHDDPQCKLQFDSLEETFYNTLEKLSREPLSVPVPTEVIKTGTFVFNRQDFLIAVHQSLYDPKLFQLLPLMITEINAGNVEMISTLVVALGKRLTLDYGTYYCVLCNETIPWNSIEEFKAGNKGLPHQISIPFYEAEFSICDDWDNQAADSLTIINKISLPALVINGEFDPIVTSSEGPPLAAIFDGFHVEAPLQGHGPTFSGCGNEMVADFFNHPEIAPDTSCFVATRPMFKTNISVKSGVSKFAEAMVSGNYMFLSGGIVAILVILIFLVTILVRSLAKLMRKRRQQISLMRTLIIAASITIIVTIVGLVIAVQSVAADNFYVLAFGLPDKFSILFVLPYVVLGLTISLCVILYLKRLSLSRSDWRVYMTMLLCFAISNFYFFYWHLL